MARRDFGLHKVGRYWHADFRLGQEHIHRSTRATTYPDARDIAEKWHREGLRKSQGLPVNTDITVEGLWNLWWDQTKTLSEGHRNRVEQDWRLFILPKFGKTMARSITTADAEELRTEYLAAPSLHQSTDPKAKQSMRSVASSNKLLLHFHLVFAWAVRVPQVISFVPFGVHILDTQEKPKATLTREQVRPFLAVIDQADNPHVHVAVRLMLYMALREREALVARWEWFDPELRTFQHGDRKGKDAPRFPVPQDLREQLLKLGQKTEGLVMSWVRKDDPDKTPIHHVGQFTKKAIERAATQCRPSAYWHATRARWPT